LQGSTWTVRRSQYCTRALKDRRQGYNSPRWPCSSYVEGNPVNYTDPSGKFIQLLLPLAFGGLIGAATSRFVAGRTWDMAHAGECGCEAQIWADGVDRNSFIAEEALRGAALGVVFTGVLLCSIRPLLLVPVLSP